MLINTLEQIRDMIIQYSVFFLTGTVVLILNLTVGVITENKKVLCFQKITIIALIIGMCIFYGYSIHTVNVQRKELMKEIKISEQLLVEKEETEKRNWQTAKTKTDEYTIYVEGIRKTANSFNINALDLHNYDIEINEKNKEIYLNRK